MKNRRIAKQIVDGDRKKQKKQKKKTKERKAKGKKQ